MNTHPILPTSPLQHPQEYVLVWRILAWQKYFCKAVVKQPKRRLLTGLLGLLAISTVTVGCGSASESDEVFVDTYDSYFQSFSYDYNPSPDLEDLGKRSTVIAEAMLVDVEDGRIFGLPGTEFPGYHLNLVFETSDETRYYVQLPRPGDSSIEQLKSVLPVGSRSVVYLTPNNDPFDGIWSNTREDGNEWYFTTPQGWILNHSERGIVFPLEWQPFPAEILAARESLSDWIVSEEQGSEALTPKNHLQDSLDEGSLDHWQVSEEQS